MSKLLDRLSDRQVVAVIVVVVVALIFFAAYPDLILDLFL